MKYANGVKKNPNLQPAKELKTLCVAAQDWKKWTERDKEAQKSKEKRNNGRDVWFGV